MSPDRAELAGTGAALAFHAALIAALSLSLAHVAKVPEPPAMEVELVDEVGLQAAAPAALAVPPPPSTAPEISQADATEPAPPPTAAPLPPAAKLVPTPAPHAIERATARPTRALPAPARTAPKASRIGADFLKGIAADAPSKANAPPRAAATVSASAMAGIVQAIRRQVQPCADRQVNPGPGASRIKVKLRLHLMLSGRLKRPPEVLATTGIDDENSRYEQRVRDLAVATFVGCSPLSGLPPDLYETTSGQGWSDFVMNYNLP